MISYKNSELCHYGVKGMKWGVRRYQNKDGTYTTAGKRRNFKKFEKTYVKDTKSGFKDHNSGKSYRDLARNNPDLAKALEPLIRSEQKLYRARQEDAKLFRKEYDKLLKSYVQKHGRNPDPEDDHTLSSIASRKVGTPNYDAQYNSYRTVGRDVVNNVLGKYGDRELNTFNVTTAKNVLRNYVTIEAQRLNREEDERNK